METSVRWGPLYIQPPPLITGHGGGTYTMGGHPYRRKQRGPPCNGDPCIREDEVTPRNGGPCVTRRMRAALKWGGLYDAIG